MRAPSGSDPRTSSVVFMKHYSSVLLFFVLSSISDLRTTAEIMGEECDWTRSLVSATEGGVTPVYLRCSAGRVTWLYPRGALRVLLRLPKRDVEFRACIRIQPDDDSDRNIDGRRPKTAAVAVRLYLEGSRSLLPLYASNDGGNKAIRCFNSKNGQAAIYVEASDVNTMSKRIAEFEYDLHALPRGVRAYDPSEECRPCTSEELAHTFCTSDLENSKGNKSCSCGDFDNGKCYVCVRDQADISNILHQACLSCGGETSKMEEAGKKYLFLKDDTQHDVTVSHDRDAVLGTIRNVKNHDDLKISQLSIKVTKLIRNTIYDSRELEANTIPDEKPNSLSEVILHLAQHCEISHGLGEFVFMARKKLGALILECAPRLEDWTKLVNRLLEDGTAHCVLRS